MQAQAVTRGCRINEMWFQPALRDGKVIFRSTLWGKEHRLAGAWFAVYILHVILKWMEPLTWNTCPLSQYNLPCVTPLLHNAVFSFGPFGYCTDNGRPGLIHALTNACKQHLDVWVLSRVSEGIDVDLTSQLRPDSDVRLLSPETKPNHNEKGSAPPPPHLLWHLAQLLQATKVSSECKCSCFSLLFDADLAKLRSQISKSSGPL